MSTPEVKKKSFDAIGALPYAGCGEFNLAEKVDGACEANRRVAVFLLKSTASFPIQYPCMQGDVHPCNKQAERKGERRRPGFKCMLYDRLIPDERGNGGGGSGEGELKEAYFENMAGARIEKVKSNMTFYLILKSSKLIGKKVDIELADNAFDLEYAGSLVEGGVLKGIQIREDAMKHESRASNRG